MSTLNRRHFLQLAGLSGAAFGLLGHQARRYGRVLAQETPRKRALLVGVNTYPNSSRFTSLKGCTTDVQLQRELLVHRFGFHPDDILILSDDAQLLPTRDNILTAFEEHLIKPCRAGDVVVFHFSGHGSRVIEANSPDGDNINATLVPMDAEQDTESVNDIMGRTLFLLTSALATEQFCGVLDSCYAGGGTRGNVRVRSAWDGQVYQIGSEERDYQTRWLRERQIPFATLQAQREMGVAKGIMLAAAQRDQEAVDVGFDGFHAGAFTYLLTQYLWQQTDSHGGTLARITQNMRALSGQVPLLDAQADRQFERSEMFFVPPSAQTPPAEAVITDVEGTEAAIWLGGIAPASLSTFAPGATLTPVGFEEEGEVELIFRSGLRGRVRLPAALPTDTLLQEFSRVIDPGLTLRIGLDPSLGAWLEAAQARMNDIARVEAVASQPGAVPYPGEVHYVLSVMTSAYQQRFAEGGVVPAAVPAVGEVGLFTRGLDDWIAGSFVADVTSGDRLVSALLPKLQLLAAARLIKATLQANSTGFQVRGLFVAEEIATTPALLNDLLDRSPGAVDTQGGFALSAIMFPTRSGGLRPHQVPIDAAGRFVLHNQEAEALYVGVVIIASDGRFIVNHPMIADGADAANADSLMQPGERRVVPALEEDPLYANTVGRGEILVIASQKPFFEVLNQLNALTEFQDQANPAKTNAPDAAFAAAEGTATLAAVDALLTETRTGQASTTPGVVRPTELSAYAIPYEVVP